MAAALGRAGRVRVKQVRADIVDPIGVEAPEPLAVSVLPGKGSRLVVSLSGVGPARFGVPPLEFVGTASAYGENHVLFISDLSRSWMNGPGVADAIVKLIEEYVGKFGITEVVALGNSMGAYSAIVLAELMPIDTVIAFTPQFSVHSDHVPEEERWMFHRAKITDWRFPTVGELACKDTAYFVLHGDNDGEVRHWARFPQSRRINHFIFRNAGHNIARMLQKRHRLAAVVQAAIENRPRVMRRQLERSFQARKFTVLRRAIYDQKYPEMAAAYISGGDALRCETGDQK